MVFFRFSHIFISSFSILSLWEATSQRRQELDRHRADGDLWVALYGQVYDLTELGSLVGLDHHNLGLKESCFGNLKREDYV